MSYRSRSRWTARLAPIALCSVAVLALGCTGGKSQPAPPGPETADTTKTAGADQGSQASDQAGAAGKTDPKPAADQAGTKEKPMSGDSDGLTQINALLAANPANEKDCGDKHTQLRRDGDKLIAEVSLETCERSYRFEVPVAKLVFDKIETEVAPEHGRGQVYILCQNDESCAAWMIRDKPDAEWRKVRDDPEFVIDLAPDADAVKKLQALLTEWRGG